jgi:hypothetical protein
MDTWNRRKTVSLVVLVGLSALAATYWAALARQPRATDVEQIRTLLVQGERAIEQRQLPAAMELVSYDYRDDHGMRYSSLRSLAGRLTRRGDRIDLTLPSHGLQIAVHPDGNRATAQTWVEFRAVSRYDSIARDGSVLVTMTFVKEPMRYYGLFPGREWRLVKMEGWQDLVAD